jgi:hypothetical protein
MVAGPAIGINVASVEGGPLCVAVTWQEGVVPTELAEGLATDLAEFMMCLHETARICYHSVKRELEKAEK